MKLDIITSKDITNAAYQIDQQGIPKDFVWSQYYIVVDNKEYPFKYLVRTAYEIVKGEKPEIESNKNYRTYIEKLGFDIRYYEGGYNFFTKQELDFYSSIVGTKYRTSNKSQKYYNQKLNPIVAKAKYWAEQLLIPGFNLRKDSNWLNGHTAIIKSYFWPRIYSGEDKDVFFNVEVNGEYQFLAYKLDGYTATQKALPPDKLKLLEDYKALINWQWPQISFDQLNNYNWDKLIRESKDYVQKYLAHHHHLKQILSKETKISRITWNTNGWIKPSGMLGKSKSSGFEKENGFGHEEWLFDGGKVIDEYKYGFLEPVHKHHSKYEGKLFDLSLYTRDSESNTNYWVAHLTDVEVLSPIEAEKVFDHYKLHGWYEDMKADLLNLNLDPNQLDKWVKQGAEMLFNVKFKRTQLDNIPTELVLISDDKEIPSYHYVLMDKTVDVDQRIKEETKSRFDFDNSGSEEANLKTKGKRKPSKKEIELELIHNDIQTKFLNYLQKRYGKKVAKRECTAYGASRIDITRKTEKGYVFYEIKTYNSLKTSIREGIGQLLEYSLFPNAYEAEQIVLVSHISASEEIKQYINHLRKYISIPFSYIHFDSVQMEIISEV
jgi:hypothetical protein